MEALEFKPTLPDWHLLHVPSRRAWIAYRNNGLYAVVTPGKEEDSQGMASVQVPSTLFGHTITFAVKRSVTRHCRAKRKVHVVNTLNKVLKSYHALVHRVRALSLARC